MQRLIIIIIIAALIGSGIAFDRFVLGCSTSITVTTLTTVKKYLVSSLNISFAESYDLKDIVLAPRAIFVKPLIVPFDGVLTIKLSKHCRSSISIFIALEVNSSISIVSPYQISRRGSTYVYSLPVSPGLYAIAISNTGFEECTISMSISLIRQ